MSKRFHVFLAIGVLALTLLVSMFVLFTPLPEGGEEGFSAVKGAEYISEISREPHSVSDLDAHETVFQYLKDTLEGFVGAGNVTEYAYTKEEVNLNPTVLSEEDPCEYDVKNLLATIPGDSETGILLVAHYDSRGHIGRDGELGRSYGAIDDGYGLATLLEIARLYAGKDLKNSIYILIADGEETGLYGSRMAAAETALMAKVGFVINVEARGNAGPVYMFETSTENAKVIDFYRQAQLPVTYSIATAVYTIMPNSTDFASFLAIGKPGVNFSTLKGIMYYHTPSDNYENINLSTLQHYGSQIVPLVEEFTSDVVYGEADYFTSSQNQVFFTILPGVLIGYTETLGNIFNLILVAALIAFLLFGILKKQLEIKKVLKYFGLIFLSIAGSAIFCYVVSRIVAFLGKASWSLTYVKMAGSELPSLLALLAVVLVLGACFQKKIVGKADKEAFLVAGVLLNLLFATLTGFALSGASFLFFVPALTGLVSLYVMAFVKKPVWNHVALSQNVIWNIMILVPLVYSLYQALTVGGLLAFAVILVIGLSVVIPSFFLQIETKFVPAGK
jgi:hypothetical protein